MAVNDGGPAFPRPASEYEGSMGQVIEHSQDGMSLRAYLMAHAPDPILGSYETAKQESGNSLNKWAGILVSRAAAWADAIIAELEKSK